MWSHTLYVYLQLSFRYHSSEVCVFVAYHQAAQHRQNQESEQDSRRDLNAIILWFHHAISFTIFIIKHVYPPRELTNFHIHLLWTKIFRRQRIYLSFENFKKLYRLLKLSFRQPKLRQRPHSSILCYISDFIYVYFSRRIHCFGFSNISNLL